MNDSWLLFAEVDEDESGELNGENVAKSIADNDDSSTDEGCIGKNGENSRWVVGIVDDSLRVTAIDEEASGDPNVENESTPSVVDLETFGLDDFSSTVMISSLKLRIS